MKAVTAIDRPYLPALIALNNSIRRNSPGVDLVCLAYGDVADDVEALGIETHRDVFVNDWLPDAEGTPAGCGPMYSRLAVPHLFGDCIWLDADQIVLAPLNPLFDLKTDKVCAAVSSTPLFHQVAGLDRHERCIYSGLIVFREGWITQRITERVIELMNARNPKYRYRFADQSYISHVLLGNFHALQSYWQGFPNRLRAPMDPLARIAHWHGRVYKPWTHPEMPGAELWRQYA